MCPQCSSSEVTRNETGQNICAKCGHVFDDIHFECPQCHKHMAGPAELINILMDCPDCGHHFKPVPGPEPKQPAPAAPSGQAGRGKWWIIILLIIVAGAAISIYVVRQHQMIAPYGDDGMYNYEPESGPHITPALVAVRDHLVSPKTASFANGEYKSDDGFVFVRLGIDSQNTYGATVRTEWGVKMKWVSVMDKGQDIGGWLVRDCRQLSGPASACK